MFGGDDDDDSPLPYRVTRNNLYALESLLAFLELKGEVDIDSPHEVDRVIEEIRLAESGLLVMFTSPDQSITNVVYRWAVEKDECSDEYSPVPLVLRWIVALYRRDDVDSCRRVLDRPLLDIDMVFDAIDIRSLSLFEYAADAMKKMHNTLDIVCMRFYLTACGTILSKGCFTISSSYCSQVLLYACSTITDDSVMLEKILRILIERHGASIDASESAALRDAAYAGHSTVVRVLIHKFGVNVHACEDEALRSAAVNGHTDIVDILMKAGANPMALDGKALRFIDRRSRSDDNVWLYDIWKKYNVEPKPWMHNKEAMALCILNVKKTYA